MQKTAAVLAAGVVLAGLAAAALLILVAPSRNPCTTTSVAGGKTAIGGPFELVNHLGETVTDQQVIDGLTLIYFGYTYCPDICPLDTTRNLEAVDLLTAQGVAVTPVFITIDPMRDTVEVLADYVSVMHEDMIGLTGSLAQITVASKAYKTFFQKNGEGEDYLMDHSTFSYLMAPNEGLLEYFRRDSTPETIAETAACFAAGL